MKINEKWLREWVNPAIDSDQLAEQLTMAGMEVEAVEKCHMDLSHVVAARVTSVEPHPDADKLKVCQVDCGGADTLTVVCGADNVRSGMHAVLACVDASLHGDKTITATELKGIKSEGMLCSAMELGLVDDAEGLLELPADTVPGQPLSDLLATEDTVIELCLTPNRGDCLSIAGIAREVAVINHCQLKPVVIDAIKPASDADRIVKLDAPDACPRYVGRVIENVDGSVATPLWLSEKLNRCGLRNINVIVDITNYVMLELGQPMHAFDHDLVNGAITVRYARDGEILVLLDNQSCRLSENTLVIADDNQVLAMAGIMGGLDSAVTGSSRNIFLESAFFNPRTILGQGRQYGLHTDSSHRFERGVDYELQRHAIERASQLILDICGGVPGPLIEVSSAQHLPKNRPIMLRANQVSRVLGLDIPAEDINQILQDLGMSVVPGDGEWQVTAPAYRFDIAIEADLIEEIARIYGYNNIPDQALVTVLNFQPNHYEQGQLRSMRGYLVHHGFQEAITYSFVDEKLQTLINPENVALRLTNPIAADMSLMRTSLWPGLLQALIYNVNRQQQRVRLFETGLVFRQQKGIVQEPAIGGVIYGNRYIKQWDIDDIPSNFFDIKLNIEGLLAACGCHEAVSYRPASHPALHPGQSAEIVMQDQRVGYLGVLHPSLQLALDLAKQILLFELEVSRFSRKITRKYQKLSKFPIVRRDLALVMMEEIPVADIMKCIGKTAQDVLKNLELFDVYQGEGIDLGKKSLALGLTFQGSSSTLTDEDVEDVVGKILERLTNEFGAKLRD